MITACALLVVAVGLLALAPIRSSVLINYPLGPKNQTETGRNSEVEVKYARGITRSGRQARDPQSYLCPLDFRRPDIHQVLQGTVSPHLFEPRPISPCSNCISPSQHAGSGDPWKEHMAAFCKHLPSVANRCGQASLCTSSPHLRL